MDPKKKFGLVIPQKKSKQIKTKSIFESDSEDDMPGAKRPKIPQKKFELRCKAKEESLEDPSIYEYDSIYDDMKAKEAEKIAPKQKKNSRYIDTLLRAADKRKKEHERRIEKKIQIEREKEGDEFRDKETFVTSSYKKKMQEREEEEERDRQVNMLNDMMDVTKQKDLSGFYRHFLNQTIGEEKIPVFDDKIKKDEIMRIKEENSSESMYSAVNREDNEKKHTKEKILHIKEEDSAECSYSVASPKDTDKNDLDRDSEGIEIDSDSDTQSNKSNKCTVGEISLTEHSAFKGKKKCLSKEENYEMDIVKPNDFRSNKNKYRRKPKETDSESNNDDEDISNHADKQSVENFEKREHNEHNSSDSSQDGYKASMISEKEPVQCTPSKNEDQAKRNIFIKRTVGDVFAEAQARYFQRMNNKITGIS